MLGPFNILDAVYQILGFFILLMLLRKYALGPVVNMMQKREKHVADQISSAEKNREEAEKYLAEQREAIQSARREAKEIVENANKQSVLQAEEIISNAKGEAERMKDKALVEINQEKERAIAALREQVSTLSVLVASKVIEKELDEKEQEKLINETLKEVGGDL